MQYFGEKYLCSINSISTDLLYNKGLILILNSFYVNFNKILRFALSTVFYSLLQESIDIKEINA